MSNSTTINRIDQDDALDAYTLADQNAGLNHVLDDLDRMIDTTEKAITGTFTGDYHASLLPI